MDATHPCAGLVTKNVRKACEKLARPYFRILRKEEATDAGEDRVSVKSVEEAVSFLQETEGRIFIATGSKELEKYTKLRNFKERCTARILPSEEAIAKAGGSEYPIVMELDAQPSWMNFLYQNGGSYLSEDGKTCNVALPESKDAIQQVVDLMDNGQMAPYSVLTETKGTDLFISGQAAIVFIGSWKSSVLEGSRLAQEGNVQLIQMPAMAVNNKTCMGGLGYVMAANCQHKAEAWEFMKYITGKDAMTREAEAGIDIPAYLDAQAGYVANFKNINAQVFMDASANGFAYPSNGNFDWTSSVDEAVQAAFGGVKTVDEALDQGAADAQAVLDEVFG